MKQTIDYAISFLPAISLFLLTLGIVITMAWIFVHCFLIPSEKRAKIKDACEEKIIKEPDLIMDYKRNKKILSN